MSNVENAVGTGLIIMLERERSALAEFKSYAWIAGANIQENVCGSKENSNLTRKGKLLLLWHQRLGHASFKLVRWLSRQGCLHGGMVDQSSDIVCDSCRIARATKRTIENSESSQSVPAGKREYNSIKCGDLKPGDRVSMDHYSSNTRGRLTK